MNGQVVIPLTRSVQQYSRRLASADADWSKEAMTRIPALSE